MQTALHIMSLVLQLKREVVGGTVVSTEFYRKERAAYFFVKKGKVRSALAFVFHPTGFGFYLVPAGKVQIDTREKPWPIFALDDATITDINQPTLDRIFTLSGEKDGDQFKVVMEAIGPNGNLWLLDGKSGMQAVLRNRKFSKGEPYRITPVPDHLDPFDLTAGSLAERLKQAGSSSTLPLASFIEKNVIGFNRTMAREAVTRAGIDMYQLAVADGEEIASLVAAIKDMAERFKTPDLGYLYEIRGGSEVYPFRLSSVETQPDKFKTLSMAVMSMASRRQTVVADADEEKQVGGAVRRAARKLQKRIDNLQSDVAGAEKYETYLKLGELLKISLGQMKKGMKSITVDDVYADPPQPVTIKLDPALSPNDNVEAYFRKQRKGREGLDLLTRRLEISRGELEQLLKMQVDLENHFDSARERYRAEIDALMPRTSGPQAAPAPRLPYREHTLTTGLKIFIGRDGADNDRTTFEYAKPYEFWFHAQQCPGSHVVMKYPNKAFKPTKLEIEETAAITAWHSKAKNDSLVPVIYTERRYVRKPRKAKPGLVTVEREKSVMVAPKKEA